MLSAKAYLCCHAEAAAINKASPSIPAVFNALPARAMERHPASTNKSAIFCFILSLHLHLRIFNLRLGFIKDLLKKDKEKF